MKIGEWCASSRIIIKMSYGVCPVNYKSDNKDIAKVMSTQDNIKVVQQMFTALGQGNLTTVLDTFADDVEFRSPVTRAKSAEITWSKPRHGRDEVAAFFKELNEKIQFERMEVLEITAEGDRVVVEGRNRGTVRSTGRKYEHDWVMIFTLEGGKIVRNQHYYDTADILMAFRGE